MAQPWCLQAELQTERQKAVLYDNSSKVLPSLGPGGRHDFIVRHDVKELGSHTLACSVSYTTAEGERKYLPQVVMLMHTVCGLLLSCLTLQPSADTNTYLRWAASAYCGLLLCPTTQLRCTSKYLPGGRTAWRLSSRLCPRRLWYCWTSDEGCLPFESRCALLCSTSSLWRATLSRSKRRSERPFAGLDQALPHIPSCRSVFQHCSPCVAALVRVLAGTDLQPLRHRADSMQPSSH